MRGSDGACAGVVGAPTAACTFSVGSAPTVTAFDGSNIWVTNSSNGGTLTKLRASDGFLMGTIATESGPLGVVFDGANIWVVNFASGNVTKRPVFPNKRRVKSQDIADVAA